MFWNVFVKLCNERGLSPNRVCADLKLSKNAATKWKQGSIPRDTTLRKISDYLNVPIDTLTGRIPQDENDELNTYLEQLRGREEMRMFFSLAKNASKEDVEAAVAMIDALNKRRNG